MSDVGVWFEEELFPLNELIGFLQRLGRYDVAAWAQKYVILDTAFQERVGALAYEELDLLPVSSVPRQDFLEALAAALVRLCEGRSRPVTLPEFTAPSRRRRTSALAESSA